MQGYVSFDHYQQGESWHGHFKNGKRSGWFVNHDTSETYYSYLLRNDDTNVFGAARLHYDKNKNITYIGKTNENGACLAGDFIHGNFVFEIANLAVEGKETGSRLVVDKDGVEREIKEYEQIRAGDMVWGR